MVRALRFGVLLALVLALMPAPAGAADLDVSFEVVRETPTSVTIRATISGATGPIQATARVEPLRDGEPVPTVRGLRVDAVERVSEYRHTPLEETKRLPIAEAMAALDAEITALKNTRGLKSQEIDARREEWHGKETELAALRSQADHGATFTETTEVVAHEYVLETRERRALVAHCNAGDTITLPPQSWAAPPPSQLLSDTELSLSPTETNWGESTAVYEWTISTGELQRRDGSWGSAGVLVVNINGQDYYDTENSSWWDSSWSYRMKLTIDNSASTEDLTDFPLMVKLTPERFDYSWCQWDGDDIRFVDSDGTALDYELDTWDREGETFYWVRVPNIPAGAADDYVWMYFGEPTVANGENAEGVWDDNYVAVYHMNNSPTDATQILDSTAKALTGTKSNAASIVEVAGAIGKAQAFNGDGAYITAALPVIGTGDYTVLAYTRSPAWVGRNAMLYGGASGSTNKGLFALILEQTSVYGFLCDGSATRIQLGTRNFNTTYHNNTWATFALTLDRDVAARHYQNGAQLGADDATITAQQGNINVNGINPPRIGWRVAGSSSTAHDIDELRLSSVARSAEWIEAENLALTDALLTYGDTEGMPEAVTDEPVVPLATALLVVAVGVVAVKQNHVILYTAAFILFLFVGFAAADDSLRTGIPIIIYAGAMLYSMMLSIGRR